MTLLRITGYDPPGRACGEFDNVHVAILLGLEPAQIVPGDVDRAVFETHVSIVETEDGGFDFSGPSVHGTRHRRRVYLAWGNPDQNGFNMFRRAMLMLGGIEDEVVRGALLDGAIEGSLSLTDPGELPRCGVLLPPEIRWSAMTVPRFAAPVHEPRPRIQGAS